MQSKAAKIGFVLLLVIFGVGAFWIYNYGPESFTRNEARASYKTYVKVEATIVSQDSNGRIGKARNVIWTIQFPTGKNSSSTTTLAKDEHSPKANGEKLVIYYDPKSPETVVDEDSYNNLMK